MNLKYKLSWTVLLGLLLFVCVPTQAQSVNARNQLKISRSYADSGDWKRCLEYAERALKEEPAYLDALYMRAFAYRELEDYDKAVADFNEVIRINPGFLATYGALAETYIKQEKYPEADKVFQQLGEQPHGSKWSNYYRGVVAYLQADLAKAEGFWRATLNEDVNFAAAHHNLGALHLAKGNNARALSKFREALDKKPEMAMYKFHVAWALEREKQTQAAQRMLLKVMEENGGDFKEASLAEALNLMTRGQNESALKVLKPVSLQYPSNLDVWILMGRAHLALKQMDEAREVLETAKELDASFQEIDHLLGQLPEKKPEPEVSPEPESSPAPSEESETPKSEPAPVED